MWHCRERREMQLLTVLIGKPEEMRPLARPSRRGERYNVKLQDVWENVRWIHKTQNRNRVLVNTITNVGVPQNTGYFLTS